MSKRRNYCLLLGGFFGLMLSLVVSANPFLEIIKKATPSARVVHLLNYFDTCQAVTQHQAKAFRLLRTIDELGIKMHDSQLRRYCQFLKYTQAKHSNLTNAQKAELFLNVGQRAEDNDDLQIAAVSRHFAGQYFFINEDYGKAFEHLLAANRSFQTLGYRQIPGISRYLYDLAYDYFFFEEYEKAIELLLKAAQYPAFNPNSAIQTYNTLGMSTSWLAATKDSTLFKKAENYFLKTREVARHYGDSLWVGIATGNLATVYKNQHLWIKALRNYQVSYRLGLKFGGASFTPSGEVLSIASMHLLLGQRDSCFHYLNHALTLQQQLSERGNSFDDEYFQKNYYEETRKYYRAIGDLPKAYDYLDSLTELDKKLSLRSKTEQISLVQKKLLIQKHQSEVEAIEFEKKTQQTQFWIAVVVLALLAGLFSWLYYLSRVRRRQERVIEAEKEKSLRLEKQIVEDELERAQADLADFVDNLNEKNVLIDSITTRLEEISQTSPETDASLPLAETRQHLLNSSLLTNEDWDEFRRRFERVYPGFFLRLRTRFADISPAEERLLALSQLRLDTRQMSRILGISPDSIHKSRYRLRKKIGPNSQLILSEFLKSLSVDATTN